MNEYLEKMRDRLDEVERSKSRGLSTRDVVAQSYDHGTWSRLIEQLKADSTAEWAAFSFYSFIYERLSERVPVDVRRDAADAVAERVKSLTPRTDEGAVIIFIIWGTLRPDHREACLGLLRHPDSLIRNIALRHSRIFLHPDEYSKLIEFRHDSEYAETGGMGGPLRFILRDEALHVLKTLTNCPAVEDDCFENTQHGRALYRSWSPFLNWFEAHKHK